MVIRSSAAQEIQELVAELRSADATGREAAAARLRVLGSRALVKLAHLVRHDPEPAARRAGLLVLDGLDDPGVVPVAMQALADADEGVRVAATTVLRPWLLRETDARVMEALVTAALDADERPAVRLAALDALSQLPREIVAPIAERAAIPPRDPGVDEPAGVHEWLAAHAGAPLSSLHDLVTLVRDRELREADAGRRQGWRVARGALHAVLARRDSRVALYDLRETFGAATAPLPVDFLSAMAALGDATCLEPIARAWAAAPDRETWWRDRLVETARTLVARHGLTARHAAVKRVRARWPGVLQPRESRRT